MKLSEDNEVNKRLMELVDRLYQSDQLSSLQRLHVMEMINEKMVKTEEVDDIDEHFGLTEKQKRPSLFQTS